MALIKEEGKDALLISVADGKATDAVECCMCGDHGLSDELVPCASCNFRSQHRYCSSLYPDAESYDTCNWCLSERNDIDGTPREKKHGRTSSQELLGSRSVRPRGRGKRGKGAEGTAKRRNMPPPPSPLGRVARDGDEGGRSPAVMPMKYVLRNRGRRYKLLDEVST
ncbi:hypothetical protein MLD38_001994 [Melastoma candidum]|uniref:Uncharacterized protein n=1 Tax=Melastoma candidum TaxID=119954 RepID=A0ACB9SNM1_9MYRT|nr:hypothetical protein MLD38_001994 [Melastoma candidum]